MDSAVGRCPLEVWQKIFSFACTDDGRTGCALSLVSRNVRDVSDHTRLQSAALFSLPQMRRFLDELQRRPPSHRSVRYLFLADTRTHNEEAGTWQYQDQASAVYSTILLVVAPALKTLTIMLPLSIHTVLPTTANLPALENLTAPGSFDSAFEGIVPLFCALPRLRRLHLNSFDRAIIFTPVDSRGMGERGDLLWFISQAAPGLVWLRLDSVQQYYQLPHDLERMTYKERPNQTSGSQDRHQPLSSSLRCVIVEPLAYKSGGSCGTGRVSHSRMIRGLQSLAAQQLASGRQPEVVLLPDCPYPVYTVGHAARDWMEVINGGDGSWRRSGTPESVSRLGKMFTWR